ncbi:MAG TPA: GNAT family N-acetyltransferase [Opitutaceae bacterium]
MEPREIFERYAAQQRNVAQPGFRSEIFPGFLRLTPTSSEAGGFIQLAKLTEENVDAAIIGQKAYFASIGRGFEWKVHDFDTPDNLVERLLAHGFKPDDTEALMVYDVAAHQPWTGALAAGMRLEQITTRDRIQDVVKAHDVANDAPYPPLAHQLEIALDRTAIFCAYDGDEPIGTGWIEFPPGGEFAEIHGGAVVPSFRGKGIYSALFDVRVQEARLRSVPFLVADAGPMSKPILLKKGFEFICETTPYRIPAQAGPVQS